MKKKLKKYREIKEKLYINEEYLVKHPNLHEVDSQWKLEKILPFIHKYISLTNKRKIKILDVGGGTGLILKNLSTYIENTFNINVNPYALDLSFKILEIQKENNPNLKITLNEDIIDTSLGDREIDLTLMIDVFEHVFNPIAVLKELKRISNYVLFKVPLDNNFQLFLLNLLRGGKIRKNIENLGHINSFNFYSLTQQIKKYLGNIVRIKFTNVFEYHLKTDYYIKSMGVFSKILNIIPKYTFKLSPKLTSLIFNDFIIILTKCN